MVYFGHEQATRTQADSGPKHAGRRVAPCAVSRVASINTVKARWHGLERIHDAVQDVQAQRVCDEIRPRRNVARAEAAPEGAGDVWTWTGIGDSKLSWYVSPGRDSSYATSNSWILRERLRVFKYHRRRAYLDHRGGLRRRCGLCPVVTDGSDPSVPPGRY